MINPVQHAQGVSTSDAAVANAPSLTDEQKFIRDLVVVKPLPNPPGQQIPAPPPVFNPATLFHLTSQSLFKAHPDSTSVVDTCKAERFFRPTESHPLPERVLAQVKEALADRLSTLSFAESPEQAMVIAKIRVSSSEQWKPCSDVATAYGLENNADALHKLCMAAVAGVAGDRVRNGESVRVVSQQHQFFTHMPNNAASISRALFCTLLPNNASD